MEKVRRAESILKEPGKEGAEEEDDTLLDDALDLQEKLRKCMDVLSPL